MLFNHAPEPVTQSQLDNITDVSYLIKLEKQYDHFIENESDLKYYESILEECLEMRDLIKVRIDKIIRIDYLRKYYLDK